MGLNLRLAVQAAALSVATTLALLGVLAWKQEALIFSPQTLAADWRPDFGPDVHEAWVDVPGARLHTLQLRLAQPLGVAFVLHGNAGNLSGWFRSVDFYRRARMDAVMLDYRGYGKSSGQIDSEAQLHGDVLAAWQSVAPRYAGLRRVIVGHSLGTGLAAALAAEVQPEQTVLVAPFFSLQALADELYAWVPGGLLRYPLRTDLALPRIRGPVLLLHGEQDRVIPPQHSQRLQALSPQAQLVRVPGAGHNDIEGFGDYRDALARALRP